MLLYCNENRLINIIPALVIISSKKINDVSPLYELLYHSEIYPGLPLSCHLKLPPYISDIIYGLHQIQAFNDVWNISRHSVPILALDRLFVRDLGAVSIRKTVLPGMAIPMLKIRRPNDRLIFNMEIAIRR